ncbi:hypothetical protein Tco_0060657 [Tanacetum coccineum]
MGTGERKPYGGSLPKCTKCHLYHNGSCTQRRAEGAMGHLPNGNVVLVWSYQTLQERLSKLKNKKMEEMGTHRDGLCSWNVEKKGKRIQET